MVVAFQAIEPVSMIKWEGRQNFDAAFDFCLLRMEISSGLRVLAAL